MKIKKKLCYSCDTEQVIWKNHKGNKYCKICWFKIKAEDNFKSNYYRKYKKPQAKSVKMQEKDRAYTIIRKSFLSENPVCNAGLPGCTVQATEVHHKKGRGKYHLVVDTWLPVCRSCHQWIEENPQEAIELGYSISRLTN
jgi:hypothetical protein